MPSLWLLEMRRVAQRQIAFSENSNNTNMFFHQFVLQMGNDELDPSHALPYNIFKKTV